MVRNVAADLLVGLVRRVQSPLNRILRQQLVCARCVLEVLVVAGLCAGINVSVDFERCNVAAGSACFRFHRHNVRIEIDERYGDAVVADACFSVHAGDMDAVGLAAGRDLGNLAPVGRRMGELDQIVNAGFYRRGCPRIVFPADVPAQLVLGVQVVRRILLERLHKVCDREGHDPCGIIRALCKRIVLPDNTRICAILPLTAVHDLVAVLPEAVDAGDGNRAAAECLVDIVAGRLFNLGALDLDDRGNVTDQLPLAVLPLPFELDALVWLRIGVGFVAILIELLNVFRSVQCDGIVVCSIHLKQAVYVCAGQDAIVLRLMRGRILDALHTDLDLRVCNVRLRAAGIVRHGRVVLLPDRVEGRAGISDLDQFSRRICGVTILRLRPALEYIILSGRGHCSNLERCLAGAGLDSLRSRCVFAAVSVEVQGVGFAVVHLTVILHNEPGRARSITITL